MILLDVNVWLATVWRGHRHHDTARQWFQDQDDDLALCRVTQMSLLRLLSNPSIMREDALSRAQAWDVVDALAADDRVVFAEEHDELELRWRALSARDDQSHKLWTDDYLAAFALAAGFSFATLDRAIADRYPALAVTLVG